MDRHSEFKTWSKHVPPLKKLPSSLHPHHYPPTWTIFWLSLEQFHPSQTQHPIFKVRPSCLILRSRDSSSLGAKFFCHFFHPPIEKAARRLPAPSALGGSLPLMSCICLEAETYRQRPHFPSYVITYEHLKLGQRQNGNKNALKEPWRPNVQDLLKYEKFLFISHLFCGVITGSVTKETPKDDSLTFSCRINLFMSREDDPLLSTLETFWFGLGLQQLSFMICMSIIGWVVGCYIV